MNSAPPAGLTRGHTDWVEDDEPVVPPIPRKVPYVPLIPKYDEQAPEPAPLPLIPQAPLRGGMESDSFLVPNKPVFDHWGRPVSLPPRLAPQVTGPDGNSYRLLPRVGRDATWPGSEAFPEDERGQVFPGQFSPPSTPSPGELIPFAPIGQQPSPTPELRGPMEELNPYQVAEQQAQNKRRYALADLALQGNRNAYGLLLQELDPPQIEAMMNELSQRPPDRSFQMPAQLPPELIPQAAPTPGPDGLIPYAPVPQFPQQAPQAPDANLMPPAPMPTAPNIPDRISSTFGNMLDMYNAAQQGQLQTLGRRQRSSGWQKFVRDFVAPGVAAFRPESADSMANIQKSMDRELAYTDKLRMNPHDYLGDLLRFGNLWQATDPSSLKAQQAAARLAETQAYHDNLQNKWSADAYWKNRKLDEVEKPLADSERKRRDTLNDAAREKIQQDWERVRQAKEALGYRAQELQMKQAESLHRMATATTPQDKARAAQAVQQAKAETQRFAIAKAMTQTYTTPDGEEHLRYPGLRIAYPQIAKEFGLNEKEKSEDEAAPVASFNPLQAGEDAWNQGQQLWNQSWKQGQQVFGQMFGGAKNAAPRLTPPQQKANPAMVGQKPRLSKAQLLERLKARGYTVEPTRPTPNGGRRT